MNNACMKLPELNCLKPSEHTTFKKLVEEISECNQALEELRIFEKENSHNWLLYSDDEVHKIRDIYKQKLNNVLGEIMDIAQVCASQLFVFEKSGIMVETMLLELRLREQMSDDIVFFTKNNCRYIYSIPTDSKATLLKTMNKIILSMGMIAQLSKFTGENGEQAVMEKNESYDKYVFELFKIILNCFNLLFSMKNTYNTDLRKLFISHVEKLVIKGYCSEDVLVQ